MRIGIPAAFAARTTCATLSEPPMLPGLMRTAATPCSIAFSARLALKWISAITGIGEKRTIRLRASASSVFGTATRTTSQPVDASRAICAVVPSTSCVFVSVIDWTTTGAPPPILTPPTVMRRSEAIPSASLAAAQPVDVVRKADEHQHQEERDSDRRDALVDLPPDGPAPQALDDREQDVAAVERQQRQQVEDRQREADQPEHLEVEREAERHRLARVVDDADGAGHVLPPRARDKSRQEGDDALRRTPRLPDAVRYRAPEAVALRIPAGLEAERVMPPELDRPDRPERLRGSA